MRSSAYDTLKYENKRLFLILQAFKLLTVSQQIYKSKVHFQANP